ncbi:MAG: HPr family phosphocarrier protein [Lachnospiraceae bacterium]|nr:HPr family phosphocarrier protein [Lachnospiraceae bacterium]
MVEKKVTVQRQDGLDAAMIAVLVQHACKYESKIYLESEDKKVNAKSIMGMMNIGVCRGGEVTIYADGSDEADALKEIEDYLVSGS